jgi:hypothetical protein
MSNPSGAVHRSPSSHDTRQKDGNWTIPENGFGHTIEAATLAVLMDIRDELKEVNRRLKMFDTASLD